MVVLWWCCGGGGDVHCSLSLSLVGGGPTYLHAVCYYYYWWWVVGGMVCVCGEWRGRGGSGRSYGS